MTAPTLRRPISTSAAEWLTDPRIIRLLANLDGTARAVKGYDRQWRIQVTLGLGEGAYMVTTEDMAMQRVHYFTDTLGATWVPEGGEPWITDNRASRTYGGIADDEDYGITLDVEISYPIEWARIARPRVLPL